MLEIILWIFLGIVTGAIAGLLPGIHPNLVNILILTLVVTTGLDPLAAAIFLATAGIVNSFTNYIPSIFLGAPEEDSALTVLPGHRMLLQGRAYEAIKMTVIGGLGSTIFCILLLPIFFITVPYVYESIKSIIQYLLLFVVAYMIFSEKGIKNIFFAILTFFLAGLLGVISLNYSSEMIFPLLSGLFGLPSLFLSIKEDTKIPKKLTKDETDIGTKKTIFGIILGSLSGIIVGLLPGIGPAQATVLAQEASGRDKQEIEDRKFLISNGCISTANTIFSIIALFLIGKGRSGLAVAIGQLIEMNLANILILLSVILFSAGVGSILTLSLTNIFSKIIKKVNYKVLCISILSFICLSVLFLTGSLGLAVCFVGFMIGLIPNIANVKRSHSMGVLMLPTLLFFFGL